MSLDTHSSVREAGEARRRERASERARSLARLCLESGVDILYVFGSRARDLAPLERERLALILEQP